ncbi:hypothetical protein BLNAU_9691 [Blattamonas nauphoetae]|uniref:Right handed beta helix domain-containing protein n=1 Tax=Blattamonas nauphoetae TaxID=2049346 RepID=A0ABQ9XV01_9EUKA|nr:hypothetical protein BLNAU_9691 [Blattamonas nauphoetae]
MNGEDKVFCWVPGNGNGCTTIADTLPRLSVLFEGKILLKCDENSESVEMEERDLTIGKRQLEVVGDGKDKVRIVDQSTSVLFSITTGSLALSCVSFVPSPTSTLVEVSDGGSFELSDVIVDGADQSGTVFTKPFFITTNGGSLTFDSVRVSTFIFQNTAPIQFTNAATTLLTIQSSNFTSITRKEGSGVVVSATLSTSSKVTIDDCQFTDCHSLDEEYGGLDITDPSITSPTAQTRGGIVRVVGGSANVGSVEITNSRFEGNSIAGGPGAGVFVQDLAIVTITSCPFKNLQTKGIAIQGAALSILSVSSSTVTSCSFDSCEITKKLSAAYAGALSVVESQIIAKDCTFKRCSSAHAIGVVFFNYVLSGSSVENCVFSDGLTDPTCLFFIFSSNGLTLSDIIFIDCGNEDTAWTPLFFGASSPNIATVDGLFVASSSLSLKKGRISVASQWLSDSSSLTFSNCQFLCDEPFITDEKDFSAGFLAPQLRIASEADLTSTVDETMCGHPSRSCKTIAFALKLCPAVLSTSEFVLISVGEGEHLEDPLVIAKKIKLTSSDVDSPAQLKAKDSTGSLLTVKQNSILVVESLSIVLTPVDTGKATISSSGTLSLTAVTFINPSPSPTLSGHLVDIIEGSGTMSRCVFPACSLSLGTSMIRIQSGTSVDLKEQDVDLTDSELGTFISIVGTTTIESCYFSNISSISSFVTGSGSLLILDSTFFSIKERDTSPSLCRSVEFSVGENQKVEIGVESKPVFFASCSSRGDGGALNCLISGSGMLALSHTTFDGCFSQTVGGGLAIRCEDGLVSSSLSINAMFTLCSSTTRPDNALHLTAFVFGPLIDSSRWIINNNQLNSPDNDPVLWGEDFMEYTESKYRSMTLLYYLFPNRHSVISASDEGRDGEGCGTSAYPCWTFSTAHSHLIGDQALTLKVVGKTRLDRSVSLSKQDLLIEPESGVGVIVVVSDGQLSNNHPSTTSHTITITHISFDVSSATAQSLISSNCGTIVFTSSTITWTGSLSTTLFSISGGSLAIDSSSPLLTSSLKLPLVSLDGGSLSMENGQFEDITLSSSLISGSGSVSIIDSSFTSLVDSTTSSSNSEPARVLTMSVGYNRKVEIGAKSKPVFFASCSSRGEGGAVLCSISGSGIFAITHTTFEACSSSSRGGACSIRLSQFSSASIRTGESVIFTDCHATTALLPGNGGGLYVSCESGGSGLMSLSNLKFEDCSADYQGGGLFASLFYSSASILLADCVFISCHVTLSGSNSVCGGGVFADAPSSTLTVTRCQFIDCSSTVLAGALVGFSSGFEMSECRIENCHSGSTGALNIVPLSDAHITFANILFIGNTVGDNPTYFKKHESMKDAVQFSDILIEPMKPANPTDVTIRDCWTTATPNSVGMYKTTNSGKPEQSYDRVDLPAFREMGPLLTQKVETSLDGVSGRIDVIVKGKVPLESQIYEMTIKEQVGGSEVTGKMKFSDGIGSLQPSSNLNLKFSTAYTITSIVGLVSSSSSSTMTNDLALIAEAWAFNLAATPSFVSFTTPDTPTDSNTVVVARGGSDSMDECGGDDLPCRTVWTGQMVGMGKGGERMSVLVRGSAEMGESFWIEGNVRMTLSSESSTQRSRVVFGGSSLSSLDGIVSISSATVQVRNLNVILPSSEESSLSGWVFVVDSEGTLEVSSIGVSGRGEIGVGFAKVKSGTGRFNSVSISSGSSFGDGVGVIVGEGKWKKISVLISEMVVRDSTTSRTPLIAFSSLSPQSTFKMEGSRFQKTRRVIASSSSLSSDGAGVIEVSTGQSRTEISDCVFESSGVIVGTGTITRAAVCITLNSSRQSLLFQI